MLHLEWWLAYTVPVGGKVRQEKGHKLQAFHYYKQCLKHKTNKYKCFKYFLTSIFNLKIISTHLPTPLSRRCISTNKKLEEMMAPSSKSDIRYNPNC